MHETMTIRKAMWWYYY